FFFVQGSGHEYGGSPRHVASNVCRHPLLLCLRAVLVVEIIRPVDGLLLAHVQGRSER
ncbi:unnamed protein product, partial [Mycena citricolor]